MFELPKLLVTGAQGQLGYELVSKAADDGFEVASCAFDQLDICDAAAVEQVLDAHAPSYVINAAGRYPASAVMAKQGLRVCSDGPSVLAIACAARGIPLIHLSCAEVFDGLAQLPYAESGDVSPISPYGVALCGGEQAVRSAIEQHVIVRTGWLFSARGQSFVRQLLELARNQSQVCVADELIGAPTSAADLARVVVAMVKQLDCGSKNWGTYHYCGSEPVTWFGFCEAIVAAARQYEDLRLDELVPVHQSELGLHPRPAYSALDCHKIRQDYGIHQRSWRTGLMQVVRTLYSWSD